MIQKIYSKRMLHLFALSMLILFLLLGACTKKDNLTGDNWSNIRPITISDSLFTAGFSYPFEVNTSGKEPVLLCGNTDTRSSIAVMRFTGIPEEFDTVQNAELSFVVLRRSPYVRSDITLSLHRLNQNWAADSTSLVLDTNISDPIHTTSITVPDTISNTSGDTLRFVIPAAQIIAWQQEDITGYNLVIKTQSDGFAEIKSVESGNGPLLKFEYRLTGNTSDKTYSSRASLDSHRISSTANELVDNSWNLQNISPSRMYLRFELDPGKFVDNAGNVLSEEQYKRCTINKAELVLYIKDNPYYNGISYSIMPHLVTRDSLDNPVVIETTDMEFISYTPTSSGYITGDSLRINITPIVQAFTSGDRENKGIILRSLQEMLNFGALSFWHYNDPLLPAGKAPQIRISYTAPFFDE